MGVPETPTWPPEEFDYWVTEKGRERLKRLTKRPYKWGYLEHLRRTDNPNPMFRIYLHDKLWSEARTLAGQSTWEDARERIENQEYRDREARWIASGAKAKLPGPTKVAEWVLKRNLYSGHVALIGLVNEVARDVYNDAEWRLADESERTEIAYWKLINRLGESLGKGVGWQRPGEAFIALNLKKEAEKQLDWDRKNRQARYSRSRPTGGVRRPVNEWTTSQYRPYAARTGRENARWKLKPKRSVDGMGTKAPIGPKYDWQFPPDVVTRSRGRSTGWLDKPKRSVVGMGPNAPLSSKYNWVFPLDIVHRSKGSSSGWLDKPKRSVVGMGPNAPLSSKYDWQFPPDVVRRSASNVNGQSAGRPVRAR
mgnify:FL=1